MSKMIFTADLHLQPFTSDNVELENGIRLKLQELINNIKQLLDYAVANKISTVIFGGDIGHHRNTIYTRPFSLFQDLLLSYDLEYRFIPGNHDGSSLYSGQNSVALLKTLPKTKVFFEPTIEDNITYIPDSQNMYEDIKNSKSNDILVSHFALSEAATDSGLKITTKFSKRDLTKFKLVLIGDYHTHQTIDHIHYPGSLIPLNRGEKGPKGFIVCDTKTLKTKFVEVTGFRKYIDIEITEESDLKEIKSIIKESETSNDFITIRNTLKEIPKEVNSIIKKTKLIVIDKYEPEEILRGITSSMSLADQMKKFLEIENIDDSLIDKYMAVGIQAIENKES